MIKKKKIPGVVSAGANSRIPMTEIAQTTRYAVPCQPANVFFFQAEDGIRVKEGCLEFRRVLFRSLLRDMDRLEDSEKELRLALEQTDAQDARARSSLAETLIRLGKNDEAARLVADALRIEPKDPDALGAQGRLLVAQGRLEEAATSLGAAAEKGDADSHIELARIYLRLRDYDRARSEVGTVLTKNPGHPWALAVLGQALVLQGERDEGLTVLRRAEAARPRRHEGPRRAPPGA